jgi:hypothetical protein
MAYACASANVKAVFLGSMAMLCAPAENAPSTSMALINMAVSFIFIVFFINQYYSKMFKVNEI